ncbi:hypothetical protein KC953_00420 [Candidatus Saccharibacteria bacterium]|nr:hypothetical protein [Candidatus Saccharibacteria bacterium]
MVAKQKRYILVGLFIVFATFFSSFSPSSVAYADTPPATDTSDTKETCAVERIGWIVCPIIQSAAVISDKAFQILSDNFLRTDPQLIQDDSGTKVAWEMARNIANVMFIIAFLAIIISQVTSMGISNYGIKRMMPRLFVAAIAVNASYYICQAAVDVTNILGYEIQNALEDVSNSLGPSVFGNAQDVGGFQHTTTPGAGILAVIAAGALGAAAVVWLTLPLLISIILFVLITVSTIIVILLLRKALIVLLIVISPIAFVLYLLPNTERLFNKWMKMFGQLLMVFPIVGLLFGAGQLASTIILVSGSEGGPERAELAQKCNPNLQEKEKDEYGDANTNAFYNLKKSANSYDTCGGGAVLLSDTNSSKSVTASWTLGLVAMGVAVTPLIAVWSVLKGSLAAAGSIGGKLSSMSGKFTQGRRKAMKEEVEKRRLINDRNYMQKGGLRGRMGNALTLGGTERRIKRKASRQYAESMFNKQYTQYVAQEAVDKDGNLTGFGKTLAGGRGASESDRQTVITNSESALRQSQQEEFKAASLRSADMSDAELNVIVDVNLDNVDVNSPKLAAAIDELGKRGDFGRLEAIMNTVANKGPSLASRTLASTLNENAGQVFTGSQIANISRGAYSTKYKETIAGNLANGVLTPEKMSALNPGLAAEVSHVAASASTPEVANHLAAGGKSQKDIFDQLATAAVAVNNDDILNKRISRIAPTLINYTNRSHPPDGRRTSP